MPVVPGPSNVLAHIPLVSDAGLPNPQDIHVLLIDDEQLSRLVVCNLLRKCEYKVTVVESGAQAIDALQRNKPGTFQLVLTDVMMPEVDGLDILRYVRTNAALAELPVIMMSANEEKDAVFEAIKGGAEEYLIKPVTKKELQNIWRYVWKRASAPQLQRPHSEPDLQLLHGSYGSAVADGATATTAGTTAAAAQQQYLPGPSQQQRQPQQQELLQSMQQLHRQQQQQGMQQPDRAVNSSRSQQQQQQQQQRGPTSPSMLLSQWLMHPKRVANHRESIWLFCEVLLLLQRLAATAAGRSVSTLIRPSKLLLHHSGSVAVSAAAAADPQEDMWYQSPEAATAATAGPAAAAAAAAGQDSYSLGVLLFELLNTAPQAAAAAGSAAASRWEALAGLRQRRLPAAFVQRYPQETALVLSITHPDAAARLSLQQLVVHESLAAALAVVQDKYRQRQQHEQQQQQVQQQQAKDADATVLFVQTCQEKKRSEVQHMRQHMVQLDAEIAEVTAVLQQQQDSSAAAAAQMVPAGSGTLGDTAAAAAAVAAVGGAETEQQQLRGSSSPATITPAAGGPVVRGREHDTDDDDDAEMERREQGRHKRRSIHIIPPAVPVLQQEQQQQLVAPSTAAAAAGQSAAAAGFADVSGKWQNVKSKFAVLEAVYLKRKQQEQAIDDQQGSSSHTAPGASASAAARACASGSGGRLRTGYLDAFADDLWAYGRYSSFAVRGTVRAAADVLGGSNAMVNAAAFDRDDEFVATAGVSKRIRIFEYSSITSSACGGGGCTTGAPVAPGMGGYSRGTAAALAGSSARAGLGAYTAGVGGAAGVDGIVYPVLELSSRSRLCSVVWSSYVKAHVASSDVEGVVQLWDANTGSEVAQFEEHAKRAWAVDFSKLEPTKLVSCSDDCTVKVWSLHQDYSVATLQLHNNVCSVQFSPDNPHLLAAGCSNAKIYLYDLRQTAQPLACVPGHDRAVSYVRWLNGNELVTASIDNTLKSWSVSGLVAAGTLGCSAGAKGPPTAVAASISAACSATYAGHTNNRNFIGLAVLPGSPGNSSSRGGYLACGSESNEVFAYHTSVPVPITSHNFSAAVRGAGGRRGLGGFGDLETLAELEGPGNAFVSCVTWNKRAGTLVAANSAGHIKVLELV